MQNDARIYTPARSAYRALRHLYRSLRAVGNRLLNLVDSPVVILVYHRVADAQRDPEDITVSPRHFRLHMEYLQRHCRIVRFDEDWTSLNKPSVAVTFDDGYADNLLQALPILEEVGVPATFFVSPGHVDSGKAFWWHRLEAALLDEGDYPPSFVLQDRLFGGKWETASLAHRQSLYRDLNQMMKKVGPDCRENWFNQLGIWSGRMNPEDFIHRPMTAEEVRTLAASPMASVGAHSVSHPVLAELDEARQREEIYDSKRELERMTGTDITTFAYPFGRKKDYNATSVRLCQEAGFRKAAANFPGQAHRWTDPFQLPRHLVRNWDQSVFAAELKAFWTR